MKQNGFILIVSLIFLVIMTMLGIAMFSGFTMDEMMSGNHREKNRSRDAAQSALIYAGFWLVQPGNSYAPGQSNIGVTCSGPYTAPLVCSNALASPSTLPWGTAVSYTPSGMTVNAAGGQGTYAASPNFYIQYLGNTNSTSAMYLVTSTAQGGNANAAAVLQAVYQVTATATDISGG